MIEPLPPDRVQVPRPEVASIPIVTVPVAAPGVTVAVSVTAVP